ncbi:hypothetical protein F5Y19DRAFT_459184 [Xylariaceae sp. FL1651]|nr:hypothetical protein F5Y19DRAFT_459184 [Xylariaceae sp. FL1651]
MPEKKVAFAPELGSTKQNLQEPPVTQQDVNSSNTDNKTALPGPGGNNPPPSRPRPSGSDVFPASPPNPTGTTSPKRPYPDPTEYSIRMGHGWTVNDGTFDHVPLNKRRKRDVPYPTFVNHTFRSMNGLTSLQLSHNAPISLCAMDTACEHIWKCLPEKARRYLLIPPPNGPAIWSDNDKNYQDMYLKMSQSVFQVMKNKETKETQYRFFADLKKRPWIIWPIWVEDRWGKDYVTIIWHSQAIDKAGNLFDQILSYAIIDPRRDPKAGADGRHQPIDDRFKRIQARLLDLWRRADCNVENARNMNIRCSPMPFDEATSAERCFAAVKALCIQVVDWYTGGMVFDHNNTIRDLHQWVNPYQQRIEMTGINAWILMATFDFNARIAVESILPNTCTEVVADGQKKLLYPYDLAGPFNEPPIAPPDYLLSADGKYTTPITLSTNTQQPAGSQPAESR